MEYSKYPESECLLKHVSERIKKRKGATLIFTGDSGDGKSYAGGRFLELWYKKHFGELFPIANVCNSVEEAIILSKNFKRLGEGIMIEELSAHAGRREALTRKNIQFNKFLDICRIKQIVIVGNAPHISFIDKHILLMAQSWVNCEQVNFKQKIVLAHPLWLQTSPHKAEPYRHKYLDGDGEPIDTCYFKLPNKEWLKQYDSLKNVSNDALFEEIILKLQHDRVEKLKKLGQKVLPKQLLDALTLRYKGYLDDEAAKKMGLKDKAIFQNYVYEAKKVLKQPEYQQFAREMAKLDK